MLVGILRGAHVSLVGALLSVYPKLFTTMMSIRPGLVSKFFLKNITSNL